MARSLKSRTATGIGVLFLCLVAISVVSFVFVNLLSDKTEALLTANYKSIRYCNEMLHALPDVPKNAAATKAFSNALRAQESNITEPGEASATRRLRSLFDALLRSAADSGLRRAINEELYRIGQVNSRALQSKNRTALQTAQNAKLWISLISGVVLLVCLSLVVNLPEYIARPVRELTAGIREIGAKNYNARIHLDRPAREFAELADAFNGMAERLYSFENSNLARLRFEKQRVETIINQMDDAVVGVDAEARILFINGMAEGLFHLRAAEVVGKHAPDVAQHNDLLRAVLGRPGIGKPLKIVVDGKEGYFIVTVREVTHDGSPLGEVFTLKNITEFKELDLSKTALLSTISHELKTPIASIKLGLKLLGSEAEGRLNDGQQQLAAAIGEDADRLLKITSELLNLTQIETGHLLFNTRSVAPAQLVAVAVEAVAALAKEREVQLSAEPPDGLPLIMADAEKTSWVLVNFLTNAIRYTPAGTAVVVRVAEAGKAVRFSVHDGGPGVPAGQQGALFRKYFQGASGTGLGLSICKEFIEAQGGTIGVAHSADPGAEFWFEMPTV